MLSLYLVSLVSVGVDSQWLGDIPIIINSLDDETKGRANAVDVLIHDLLDYGCLSSIV